MFSDISFGQYYPVNSAVHKLDARTKLLLTLLFIVSIFFVDTYFSYLLIAVFLFSVVMFARLPLLSVLKSVKGILFIVIFTSVLNLFFVREGRILVSWRIAPWWLLQITETGVHASIKLALRLVLLITGASLLSLTTTPIELTDAMERLLKPLKLVRFPVHDVAIIMSIALRFIPSLLEETTKIMNAQKARGASFDSGGLFARAKAMLPILIPLFVSSFRRADELAYALDARCYNATDKRTKMKVAHFRLSDLFALLFEAAFVVVIFLDRYFFFGLDKIIFGLVY
ncbi:MAG TPA: energy-coupling factor transporter transmembrane component T [Clostridia bacterium]|nr:energy-coupling factor transporter transmembrane component T [Clostridia bacterium]